MRNSCACAKTTVFPRFLYGFYTSQALCSSHKTTQNHSRSLSNRASCKNCAKNVSWGGFWEGLPLSGAALGRLLVALGRLLASLGCFLGVSWALLGRSWLSLGCSVTVWSFRAAFWLPEPSQASILEGAGTSQTSF